MDQNSKEKILENLTAAENILIAVDPNTGFDGLAAGLSLYLSCSKLAKNISIYAKEPSVGDAQRLYGVDKIGKKQTSRNLVVVVDNAVNTVDKVTYFLEKDKLKIIVHPLPPDKNISHEQVSIEKNSQNADFIFTIGYNSKSDLEKDLGTEQIIDSNTWIIGINKEELEQKFAQAHFVNQQSSSLSEVTASLIQEFALPIDEDIAYNLYTGIANATSQFSAAKSTPSALQIAAWLMKFGAGKASFAQSPKLPAEPQKQPDLLRIEPEPANFNSQQKANPEELIEKDKPLEDDWFKPPKIYKGSKSFDSEY